MSEIEIEIDIPFNNPNLRETYIESLNDFEKGLSQLNKIAEDIRMVQGTLSRFAVQPFEMKATDDITLRWDGLRIHVKEGSEEWHLLGSPIYLRFGTYKYLPEFMKMASKQTQQPQDKGD